MDEITSQRYIVLWRKTGEQCLDWDSYLALHYDEAKEVIKNITAQGVRQYHTYPIGEMVPELSSSY